MWVELHNRVLKYARWDASLPVQCTRIAARLLSDVADFGESWIPYCGDFGSWCLALLVPCTGMQATRAPTFGPLVLVDTG
jgi:hypothetical protein